MTDPKETKIEETIKSSGASVEEGDLADAELEKVTGGAMWLCGAGSPTIVI